MEQPGRDEGVGEAPGRVARKRLDFIIYDDILPTSIPDGTLMLEPRDLFDPALVGVAHQGGVHYAVYSRAKTIEALANEPDGNYEDAVEHYEFNVSGSIGVGFPVFLLDGEDE